MDWFDHQIVQFVIRWAPFGGPPDEDILPRFGLTPAQLHKRFDAIVATLAQAGPGLNEEEAELLATIRRLPVASRRSRSKVG
ncbi:hypothetical protein [Mycolicibacterium palauense]|uniref:hypothetical protein n=1 Tax=Mycolicibacterium palauense TaxID=2034511 RepID=UPI000BFEF1A8|nr:hypothetical protein [Mycolicibacterium palauense]